MKHKVDTLLLKKAIEDYHSTSSGKMIGFDLHDEFVKDNDSQLCILYIKLWKLCILNFVSTNSDGVLMVVIEIVTWKSS